MDKQKFKSSYFFRILSGDFNPFTPNVIVIDNDHIEYRRRNWYLISVDTENLHFQNVAGISVDKHLFGATLIIKSTGDNDIYVDGFKKKKANVIKEICYQLISENSQKGTTEMLSAAMSDAYNKSNISVADELVKLKGLLDSGVLSQEEFDAQKKQLIS